MRIGRDSLLLPVAAATACLLFAGSARAQSPTAFTDAAQWQAAVGPVTTIGFDGIASPGNWASFDTPSGLTRQGVRFIGISADNPSRPFYLRVVDPAFYAPYYDWGSGAILHGAPVPVGPAGEGGPGSQIRVILPDGITAVGTEVMSFLQFASSFSIVVTNASGSFTFEIDSLAHPNRAFVGFTSNSPITSLAFYANEGFPILDNFAFGLKRRNRTTEDQPDDISGPQVHVMYVLPSDRADEHVDTNGAIRNSVLAFDSWLRVQTSGQSLRLDTFHGALDVTFFQLPVTDAEIRSHGVFAREEIESQLSHAGLLTASKMYAVYYGGGSDFSCGSASWPPDVTGQVVAMHLHGTPPGAPPCDTNALGASPVATGYLEFAMLHELVHSFGFVNECAPHHTLRGHVSDDPHDLMYAGPLPWQPSILDVGHDDYFAHDNAGCADDLGDAPYMTLRRSARALLVAPDAGSGAARTFTFLYSDLQGARDLTWARVRFGTTPGAGAGTCTASYNAATDEVSLLNDAGTASQTGRMGSGTLSNSQCALDLALSGATASGNDVAVTLRLTFTASFAGEKNIYMRATSNSGLTSGWVMRGVWIVGANVNAIGVVPNAGAGVTRTFALAYTDELGAAADLKSAQVRFASAPNVAAGACTVTVNAMTSQVRIQDDLGNNGPWTPMPSTSTLSNSQCSVNLSQSSATTSGDDLLMNLRITFTANLQGPRNIYMRATSNWGSTTGWRNSGAFSVRADVDATSITPNDGTGAARVFTLAFVDSEGVTADLKSARVRFRAAGGGPACIVDYNAMTNKVRIQRDDGSWTNFKSFGTLTPLVNSQCALNLVSSSAAPSGPYLTMTLDLAFKPAFAGAKNVDMRAESNVGLYTPWVNRGQWTVP